MSRNANTNSAQRHSTPMPAPVCATGLMDKKDPAQYKTKIGPKQKDRDDAKKDRDDRRKQGRTEEFRPAIAE